MREKLIQYVNLLFEGAAGSDDIRQEILQNTLDRYDDLINQGKSPETSYHLSISGIGDISEILGHSTDSGRNHVDTESTEDEGAAKRKKTHAIAVGMYIASPIPLMILTEFNLSTLGVCLMLLLVAGATVLILMNRKEEPETKVPEIADEIQLRKQRIGKIVTAVGILFYLYISFATHTWILTWLVFPIIACMKGIINAIIDLMEGNNYES